MIYFDNAATTFPKPNTVLDETIKCISNYCGNPGRGSHFMSRAAADAIYECREKLACTFGAADPSLCVFTLNTTYALNIALKISVKRGDHILISDMEHNSVYRQVMKLNSDGIASFDIFRTYGCNSDQIADNIIKKIKHNTKILICQIASNICAHSMPVAKVGKICRANGIKFIADAAQGAGIVDLNVIDMNIFALCVPSHKGLYGPQGAGAVIFSDYGAKYLQTYVEGGSGSNSLSALMPDDLPDRYEAGTLPTPAIAGLGRGLDYISDIGIDGIRAHERELANLLYSELKNDRKYTVYGNSPEYGIVLFNDRRFPSTRVAEELDRMGICLRAGFHCSPLAHKTLNTGPSGAVRASFGIFNKKSEIYELLDALRKV